MVQKKTTKVSTGKFVSKRCLYVLAVALTLRLLLAYVILPDSGYLGDVTLYSQWALAIASGGPRAFYATTSANYPPGYIYVLWTIGAIAREVSSLSSIDTQRVIVLLIKIPPILLDLGCGILLYRIVLQWRGKEIHQENKALIAAACYLFNPVSFYDSAIWGQTDASGAFIMLLGVMALMRWPSEVAATVAMIAVLIKPQYGVVLVPLVTAVLIRRHLVRNHGPLADTGPRPTIGDGAVRTLTCALVASVVLYVLIIPFGLSPRSFLARMVDTAQQYQYLTVNAFNPWALVAGIDDFASDRVPIMGSLTGATIGMVLLSAAFLMGMARLLWRSDPLSIVLVGAYLCLCFFILPTRVHERYVFPAFAFTSVLAAMDRRWLWANVLLAVGTLMNFHAILSLIGTENVRRLPFGEFLRSPSGVFLGVIIQTAIMAFSTWCLRLGATGTYERQPLKEMTWPQLRLRRLQDRLGIKKPETK